MKTFCKRQAFDGGFKSVVSRASLVGIAFSFDSIRVSKGTRSLQRFETDWVNPLPPEPLAAKPTENFACQFMAFSQHSFPRFRCWEVTGNLWQAVNGRTTMACYPPHVSKFVSYPRDSRLRIPVRTKGLLLTDAKYPMFLGMKAWRTPKDKGCGRTGSVLLLFSCLAFASLALTSLKCREIFFNDFNQRSSQRFTRSLQRCHGHRSSHDRNL
jgi:hypothetical protein